MLDSKRPGRVRSLRGSRGVREEIDDIRLEGVAIILPPGVKILKVHIFLSEGVAPMIFEECRHFLAINGRVFPHPFCEQVEGAHVARAEPFDPMQNLFLPGGKFIFGEMDLGRGQ
eukprot:13549378-Heterocapsa_arctica.AAC.1